MFLFTIIIIIIIIMEEFLLGIAIAIIIIIIIIIFSKSLRKGYLFGQERLKEIGWDHRAGSPRVVE